MPGGGLGLDHSTAGPGESDARGGMERTSPRGRTPAPRRAKGRARRAAAGRQANETNALWIKSPWPCRYRIIGAGGGWHALRPGAMEVPAPPRFMVVPHGRWPELAQPADHWRT